MKKEMILFALITVLLVSFVAADELEPVRQQRLKYGPSLYILSVKTLPEEIQPGSDATISFTIKNVAQYTLRDIIMDLELPSQFAPKDTSKKKIRSLEGLNSSETVFGVTALPDSQEGIYKIPFRITYLDDIGNSYSENTTISLKISTKPKIFAEIASSGIYEGNLLGTIDLRLANTGVGNIKFLVIEMLPSSNYEVTGPNKDYVGEIASDDYETVDFKLKVKQAKGVVNLLFKLDFSDANNKEYTETIEIPLKILSAKDAGVKQNNNLVVLVIIGILVLYIIYRQIRKKLKKR